MEITISHQVLELLRWLQLGQSVSRTRFRLPFSNSKYGHRISAAKLGGGSLHRQSRRLQVSRIERVNNDHLSWC